MDRVLERYLNRIGFDKDRSEFEGGYFANIVTTKGSNSFKATLVLRKLLNFETYREFFSSIDFFEKDLSNSFKSDLSFNYLDTIHEEDIRKLIDAFLDFNDFYDLGSYTIKEDERQIYIDYSSSFDIVSLKKEAAKLQTFINKISLGYQSFLIRTSYANINQDDNFDLDESYKESVRRNIDMFNEKEKLQKEQELKDRTYIPCKMKDAQGLKRVEVVGDIFKIEERDIKNHTLKLYIISYSDGTYSYSSNLFEGKKFTRDFLSSLKEGTRIRVKGELKYDDYAKETMINVNSLKVEEPLKPREEEYQGEERRVEFHAHSKMSAMDGVAEVKDYFKAAAAFKMKALAIVDHANVQAFPQVSQCAKKYGIKAIYGSELYMVDSSLKIAINPSEDLIKDATYVVFDIETTGLSSRYDRIIEFGATKYHKGETIDEIDFFINPDMKLSPVTTNLTHITDEDVRYGKPIKEALRIIKEFVKDTVLIAHNATFDFGFINEALKNNNMDILTNPVIDTLPLSRYFFPEQRSHRLGACCRTLGIEYDELSAHRAVYDAKVLLGVWEAMETKLLNTDINYKHKDLNLLTSDKVVLNARPTHITCYAKNQQGLKDLFKIISESNITYFKEVPRVPRFLIEKYRENLIIGSACSNSEIFDISMTKSEEETIKAMEFYDFIEVQPPLCTINLVNDGSISSFEKLQNVIKDIINAAKKAKKLVVATSDCHYVNKEDKVFRDVYVFAKGLKGARHPLNPFSRDKMKYYDNPEQHFRTTKEMLDEFEFLNDEELAKEIVITNTNLLADMFEKVEPLKDKLYTPTIENCDKMLIERVYKKAHEWYGDPLPKEIEERLKAELDGIGSNNYYVIYYIASELVGQANRDGYIVGSRGSVGSSLVATMASITEVNPLPPHYRCPKCKHLEFADPVKYQSGFDLEDKNCPICGTKMINDGQNIPFATFLGFKADKVPDIDLNLPSDYQAHAHELTKELLGKDNVFKAGTIESVAEKNAIGYVKGYFEYLEENCKDLGIRADEVSKAEIERLALGCQGVKRTTGQHPGGIIVIPSNMSVYDFTPIQYPADKEDASWKTTHFDFHSIHDNVLKLDLLGHVDPMALKMMSSLANKNIADIPFNDKEVMSLFTSPDALKLQYNDLNLELGTLGMPEFGTNFVMGLLKDTKPHTFGDLLIISGLSHGTNVYAGNQENLIKNNITDLRGCIGCRDDIMTGLHDKYGLEYTDTFQIMELVRKNKFTKPENAEKRAKYEKMMREHGVPEYYIDSCCKIQYLFPRGHAVAYCMMGVRVGWFKVHEPLAFYATYFTCRADQFDLKVMSRGRLAIKNRVQELLNSAKTQKLSATEQDLLLVLQIALEMVDRGFSFGKVSINNSDATTFKIDKEHNGLIPPFSALSGLGESVATSIVKARNERRFSSIEDLRERTRISLQKIEELRELGALEDLPESDQMTLF